MLRIMAPARTHAQTSVNAIVTDAGGGDFRNLRPCTFADLLADQSRAWRTSGARRPNSSVALRYSTTLHGHPRGCACEHRRDGVQHAAARRLTSLPPRIRVKCAFHQLARIAGNLKSNSGWLACSASCMRRDLPAACDSCVSGANSRQPAVCECRALDAAATSAAAAPPQALRRACADGWAQISLAVD